MDTYIVTQEQIAMLLDETVSGDPFLLVRRCLLEHGLSPWASPQIEMFVSGSLKLLLARPSPPRRRRLRKGEPRLRRRS